MALNTGYLFEKCFPNRIFFSRSSTIIYTNSLENMKGIGVGPINDYLSNGVIWCVSVLVIEYFSKVLPNVLAGSSRFLELS